MGFWIFLLCPLLMFVIAAILTTLWLKKKSDNVRPSCVDGYICVPKNSFYYRVVKFTHYFGSSVWENNSNLCPSTRRFFYGVTLFPIFFPFIWINNYMDNKSEAKLPSGPVLWGEKKDKIILSATDLILLFFFGPIVVQLAITFCAYIIFLFKYGLFSMWVFGVFYGLCMVVVSLIAIIIMVACEVPQKFAKVFASIFPDTAVRIKTLAINLFNSVKQIGNLILEPFRLIRKAADWKIPVGDDSTIYNEPLEVKYFILIAFSLAYLVQGNVSIITSLYCWHVYEWEHLFIWLTAIIDIIFIVIFIVCLYSEYEDNSTLKTIISYFKAKHDMICPPIKFVDVVENP